MKFIRDKTIKIIFFTITAFYISVLLVDIFSHPPLNYVSSLNGLTSLTILIYWVNKQLRITQHIFELREAIVLVAEFVFAGVAVYTVLSNTTNIFFITTQYIIYGLHFISLLLFLFYMLTFKMKRLF